MVIMSCLPLPRDIKAATSPICPLYTTEDTNRRMKIKCMNRHRNEVNQLAFNCGGLTIPFVSLQSLGPIVGGNSSHRASWRSHADKR